MVGRSLKSCCKVNEERKHEIKGKIIIQQNILHTDCNQRESTVAAGAG